MSNIWVAIDAISNCVVATGVFAALYQIRSAKEQDAVAFEDKLNIEYREIIRTVDVNVMLGDALPAQNYLSSIYNYFDLCNEQIFLRQRGRVSDRRWDEWIDGMEGNFSLPTMRSAWEHISEKSPEELKRLKQSNFREDPKKWK